MRDLLSTDRDAANRLEHELLLSFKAHQGTLPAYCVPIAVHVSTITWTDANGLLTPSHKIQRNALRQRYADEIEALYVLGEKRIDAQEAQADHAVKSALQKIGISDEEENLQIDSLSGNVF